MMSSCESGAGCTFIADSQQRHSSRGFLKFRCAKSKTACRKQAVHPRVRKSGVKAGLDSRSSVVIAVFVPAIRRPVLFLERLKPSAEPRPRLFQRCRHGGPPKTHIVTHIVYILRAVAPRSDRRHISALCKNRDGTARPTPNNSFNRG
jgi:hypothetical protein